MSRRLTALGLVSTLALAACATAPAYEAREPQPVPALDPPELESPQAGSAGGRVLTFAQPEGDEAVARVVG